MSQPGLPAKAQSASSAGSRFRSLWLPALICLLLLVGEVRLLLRDLSVGGTAKHGPTVQIATFETGKNEVRQKSGGTILWQPPSPGQSLYQQDSIATMPNSEASVRFADGSELVIEPDSLIVFEEATFPKDGGPAKIMARLVRGSLKRKNAGPSTLLVKLPGQEAPVELADPHGGAIFRVVYRSNGIEVVVESGGVRMNGKDITPAPPTKLPSPNLKKPEIEIRKIKNETSLWDLIADLGGTTAWAAEATPEQSWLISIHFAWETVPGADTYRIQIARDKGFQSVILDKVVKETTFDYQSNLPPEPQTLYMHVAAQDASGALGDYSPLEQIHIQSVSEISREYVAPSPSPSPSPTPSPSPKPSPTPTPSPTPRPHKKKPHPTISPPKPVVKSTESVNHFELAYGILYQSRTFKGSSLPSTVSASGLVPANLQLEFSHVRADGGGYKLGASYTAEVVEPGSSGAVLQNGKIGVPVVRAWFLFEKAFDGWTGGVGPYATNSYKFTWSGTSTTLTAQSQRLFGALVDAVKETKSLQWRAELGIVGLGGTGADASLTARKWLFSGHTYFGELGALLRFNSIENSYGGTLGFGASF